MLSCLTTAFAALVLTGGIAAASAAPIVLQDQATASQQRDDTSGRTVLPFTLQEHRAFERAKDHPLR